MPPSLSRLITPANRGRRDVPRDLVVRVLPDAPEPGRADQRRCSRNRPPDEVTKTGAVFLRDESEPLPDGHEEPNIASEAPRRATFRRRFPDWHLPLRFVPGARLRRPGLRGPHPFDPRIKRQSRRPGGRRDRAGQEPIPAHSWLGEPKQLSSDAPGSSGVNRKPCVTRRRSHARGS